MIIIPEEARVFFFSLRGTCRFLGKARRNAQKSMENRKNKAEKANRNKKRHTHTQKDCRVKAKI